MMTVMMMAMMTTLWTTINNSDDDSNDDIAYISLMRILMTEIMTKDTVGQ
jgi:hypothetical protein